LTSPFGPLVIIANPRAGQGKVERHLPEIERTLAGGDLKYRVVRTTHPGHATEAARDALESGDRYLVAAGGDGTVHEVLNGMLEAGVEAARDAVLGVVAAGSGCDLVKSLGLPGDAVQASQHLLGDAVRDIDVGKVTFTADGKEERRYFANIAEAGLGAAVVARTGRLPRSLGAAKYFCGFWLTLPAFHPAIVRLDADDSSFEWRAHNVVVANCQYFGGGMHISPKSQPDDGMLDVLAMVGPKTEAFTMLPKIYKGRHVPHRHIAEARARTVRIDANPPLLIEADGEMLGTTPATFAVVPHAIRVKV
jgi:YegS/Rv2252/BmrU family lipid kinase